MKVSNPEKKSFNLVDENWIPATIGHVSLRTIFSNYEIPDLVVNPVDRISLFNKVYKKNILAKTDQKPYHILF